jgi:hypothetical protein
MMGLVLLGLASCSILGVGAFLTFCVMFARQDDKVLQRKSCSCDNEWPDGATMLEPNGNYDWSHIPDNPKIKASDLFE